MYECIAIGLLILFIALYIIRIIYWLDGAVEKYRRRARLIQRNKMSDNDCKK